MNRHVKLIFNPLANKGHALKTVPSLQAITQNYPNTSWVTTEYPGQAAELARKAAEDGYNIIAALGGDGTVHEVVNGLMQIPKENRPHLGIVPLGSGNDFGINNGIIPDPEKAIMRVFSGLSKCVDIGYVKDDRGKIAYWDNTLGIGFDAAVTIQARKINRLQGFPMYLWAVIKTIIQHHDVAQMRIETNVETIEQDVLMIVFCNGPREGGGFHVAPDAKSDDNILDFAMIKNVSRLMMFRLIPEVMRGTHGRFRQVRLGQFKQLRLQFDRPMPIHTDGEIYADFSSNIRELSIQILNHELQIIV